MKYDVILLSSSIGIRSIGSYRIRTVLEQHGYNVKIIDFCSSQIESSSVLRALITRYCSSETKMIGFSTTFWFERDDDTPSTIVEDDGVKDIHKLNQLTTWIKSSWPDVTIVLGGAQAYETNVSNIDYKVVGYADTSIIALMDKITGKNDNLKLKILHNKKNNIPIVDGWNDYKDIDIDTINTVFKPEDYISPNEPLPIEISRGCIFKCDFCYYPLNGKKKFDYMRTVDAIADEMIYNYINFGTSNYEFVDDTYNDSAFKLNMFDDVLSKVKNTVSPAPEIRFISYIKPELLVRWPEQIPWLKEQGLRGCTMGIESLHPEARASISKGKNIDKILDACAEMNKFSNNQGSMIFGLPHESIESMTTGIDTLVKADIFSIVSVKSLRMYHPLYALESISERSLIDQNPEKYGYDIDLKDTSRWPYANWKNKYTTYEEVITLTDQYNKKLYNLCTPGSWSLDRILFANLDIDYHIKNKTTYLDINSELVEKHQIAINNYHSKIWANRSGAPRWAAKNNIRYDYTIYHDILKKD
jgi:hypothetical protein